MPKSEQRNALLGVNARQVREVSCRVRAQLALGDDPRYRWLCDRSLVGGARPQSWRPQLLSELGRLAEEQGKETMLELAAQLCEAKPSTEDGLQMIRQRRLEGDASPALPLTIALLEFLQTYRKEHPGLDKELLLRALGDALSELSGAG